MVGRSIAAATPPADRDEALPGGSEQFARLAPDGVRAPGNRWHASAAASCSYRHRPNRNVFLDVHGVLDADYEAAVANGEKLWILQAHRMTIPWPGRKMVIVDSQAAERPAWSPLPTAPGATPPPATPMPRHVEPLSLSA